VQNVRNRLGALEKRGLVIKDGKGKKMISFAPSIKVESAGNILLEYNFLYLETKESKGSNSKVEPEIAAL
jgi:hypothetical protein